MTVWILLNSISLNSEKESMIIVKEICLLKSILSPLGCRQIFKRSTAATVGDRHDLFSRVQSLAFSESTGILPWYAVYLENDSSYN